MPLFMRFFFDSSHRHWSPTKNAHLSGSSTLPFSEAWQASCMRVLPVIRFLYAQSQYFIIYNNRNRDLVASHSRAKPLHVLSWVWIPLAFFYARFSYFFYVRVRCALFLCACLCHWPDLPWVDIKQQKKTKSRFSAPPTPLAPRLPFRSYINHQNAK